MNIGIDISGSAVRAAALDRSGRLILGGSAQAAVQPEGVPVPFLPDLIGRSPADPALPEISSLFGISFAKGDDGHAGIKLPSGAVMAPEEAVGGMIAEVRQKAEASYGQRTDEAVLAVPGFLTRSARDAVAKAAEKAGIRVLRVVSRGYASAVAASASLAVHGRPGVIAALEISEMGWSFHLSGFDPDRNRGFSAFDGFAAAGGDTGMFMLDYDIASGLLDGGTPDNELMMTVRRLRSILRNREGAEGIYRGQRVTLTREWVAESAAETFRKPLSVIAERMRMFGISRGAVGLIVSADTGGYTGLPGVLCSCCPEVMARAQDAEYDSLGGAAILCLYGSSAAEEAFPYGLSGEILLRPSAPSGYGSLPRRISARSVPVDILPPGASLMNSRPARIEIPSGMTPYGLALTENGMPLGRFGFGRSEGVSDHPVFGEVSLKPSAGALNAVLANVRVPDLGLDITAEVSPSAEGSAEQKTEQPETAGSGAGDASGPASSAASASASAAGAAAAASASASASARAEGGQERPESDGSGGDPEMVPRSRMEREIEKARDFAVTGFAKSLLAPLDAMEAALSHMGDDPALAAYRDGTIQIYRLFLKAFSDNGLIQIDPEKGSPFDPNTEEAIASVGGGDGSEVIIETKAKGYSLNGRCIRYAKVIIGSSGAGGD